MKKYLVIGNPIKHSLSPKLHNYWIKQNNLDAVYDKKRLNESDVEEIIMEVKNGTEVLATFQIKANSSSHLSNLKFVFVIFHSIIFTFLLQFKSGQKS